MSLSGILSFKALLHCGVYALVKKDEVVYVGKTKKLWIRLYNHCNERGKVLPKRSGAKGVPFDDIWVWPCMLGQLDSLEVHLIQKYLPRHNAKGKALPVMAIPLEIKELLRQMVVITDLPLSQDIPTRYIQRRL